LKNTKFVNKINLVVGSKLVLKVLDYSNFYLILFMLYSYKESKKKNYNWMILFGFEESQTIPVWPHKSFERSQFRLPFDVNEL